MNSQNRVISADDWGGGGMDEEKLYTVSDFDILASLCS